MSHYFLKFLIIAKVVISTSICISIKNLLKNNLFKWWNYTFDLPRSVIFIYENPNGLLIIRKENSTHFNAILGSR